MANSSLGKGAKLIQKRKESPTNLIRTIGHPYIKWTSLNLTFSTIVNSKGNKTKYKTMNLSEENKAENLCDQRFGKLGKIPKMKRNKLHRSLKLMLCERHY